ncbi:MAG TPA: GNAT family N-acetyltransferase [Flavisolibacter sp.]|nr:GNAT family N-acetyltransferase [Flavisolibacter sp.]HWJ92750.1 GNAT family N-acetyltransferase [Flavisolibacter sp.]
MNDVLYNPVYHALLTGDAHLANGTGEVKYFDEEVSPFVAFPDDYDKGFDELYNVLPPGRRILYAIPQSITEPRGWKVMASVKGLQFLFAGEKIQIRPSIGLLPLDKRHAAEMVQLAALTKPGPFNMRTIEFGHYHGVFDKGKLVAMTGQRLHVENYTELSAVCTHPDHLGKGYAAALMQHQINLILDQGQIPFLHVRADNERAIALYERLGFEVNREMNFYFMKK